jgi:hemolysin-activating ACP:hemolysin acyltransferase
MFCERSSTRLAVAAGRTVQFLSVPCLPELFGFSLLWMEPQQCCSHAQTHGQPLHLPAWILVDDSTHRAATDRSENQRPLRLLCVNENDLLLS